MTDQGQALQLAGQVAEEADRYPEELAAAAVMLLLEPDSSVVAEEFMELYGNADTALRLVGEKDLGWPPSKHRYYTRAELHRPGVHVGREPLRGWDLKLFQLRKHELVTGMSGSGKTNTLLNQAREIARLNRTGVNDGAIIIDSHDNFGGLARFGYTVLDTHELRLPLFCDVTPGFVRKIIMLISELRGLIKSRNLIAEAWQRVNAVLPASEAPTLTHVIRALQNLWFDDTKNDYRLSALTELKDLQASMGATWDWTSSQMPELLFSPGQLTVIRTQGLDIGEERLLVGWLGTYGIETGNAWGRNHQVYLILDEAQPIYQKEWTKGNALRSLRGQILSARQPGICLLAGTQMPSQAEPELLASCSSILCCGLQDSENIKAVASAMGIPHGPAHDLFQGLEINEAIFKNADRPGPFRIEIPKA